MSQWRLWTKISPVITAHWRSFAFQTELEPAGIRIPERGLIEHRFWTVSQRARQASPKLLMPPVRGHTFQRGRALAKLFFLDCLPSGRDCFGDKMPWELEAWNVLRKHVGLLACSLLIWKDDEQKCWFLQPLFQWIWVTRVLFPECYTLWKTDQIRFAFSHPPQSSSWNMWTSLQWWRLLQGSLLSSWPDASSQASYLLPHHYCNKFKHISLLITSQNRLLIYAC